MRLSSLAVLAGAAGLIAALPGAAPAAAAGSDLVAVVIDFGTGGPAPIVQCVHDAGASEAQAVADALLQAHRQAMTFASSGLLCSIDGYPSTGCGESTGSGHYAYWAYFHGSASSWTFASDGPASHRASSSSTVGFRFEPDGTGSPSDPAPTPSSNPVTDCPAIASAPAEVPTPSTSPVTTPVSGAVTPTTATGSSSYPTATTMTVLKASRRASASSAASIRPSRGTPGSSSVVPAIVALGAFGALGAAAGAVWFKRRRAG